MLQDQEKKCEWKIFSVIWNGWLIILYGMQSTDFSNICLQSHTHFKVLAIQPELRVFIVVCAKRKSKQEWHKASWHCTKLHKYSFRFCYRQINEFSVSGWRGLSNPFITCLRSPSCQLSSMSSIFFKQHSCKITILGEVPKMLHFV